MNRASFVPWHRARMALLLAALAVASTPSARAQGFGRPDSVLAAQLPDTINSGVPIYLFGIQHPSPHVFTWSERTLFLDGTQIDPMPPTSRTTPISMVEEKNDLVQQAQRAAHASRDLASARQAFMAVFDSSHLVARTRLDSQRNVLTVIFRDSSRNDAHLVGPDLAPRAAPATGLSALLLYQTLSGDLRQHRLMFFGRRYRWGTSPDDVETLDQIRKASAAHNDSLPGPLPPLVLQDILAANH